MGGRASGALAVFQAGFLFGLQGVSLNHYVSAPWSWEGVSLGLTGPLYTWGPFQKAGLQNGVRTETQAYLTYGNLGLRSCMGI